MTDVTLNQNAPTSQMRRTVTTVSVRLLFLGKRDYMVRKSSAVVVMDSILLVANCYLHVGVIKSCDNLNCSGVDLIAALNISDKNVP